MRSIATAAATDIVSVYAGPEGDRYFLLMGQQLHVG
jgi:hypothetical protein